MADVEFKIVTGPMFAKKTSRLMQEIEDAVVARDTVLVLKPATDNREERNLFTKIKENENLTGYSKLICKEIKDAQEIYDLAKEHGPDIIVIDEVQFLSQGSALVIQKILDEYRNKENFLIVAAGLETDYRRELFGPTHLLMAMADKVIKLKAVCNRCRKKNAIFTWRKGDSTLQVIVGGKGLYEARCRKCYPEKDSSQ